MNKKIYKDITAALIVLGIIGIMFGIERFARYASPQAKEYVVMGLFGILILIAACAFWFLIREILD